MPKIILCRGIQGSGKSTWAKQWVLEDPEHRVRFNNDDVRNMLGRYWVPSREHIVNYIRVQMLVASMYCTKPFDIVVDNMNLNEEEVSRYKVLIETFNSSSFSDANKFKYELEYKDFFVPLEVCIERDSKRENPVGEEIIRATYEKYKHIIG